MHSSQMSDPLLEKYFTALSAADQERIYEISDLIEKNLTLYQKETLKDRTWLKLPYQFVMQYFDESDTVDFILNVFQFSFDRISFLHTKKPKKSIYRLVFDVDSCSSLPSEIVPDNLDKLVRFSGTICRISPFKPRISRFVFECSKCSVKSSVPNLDDTYPSVSICKCKKPTFVINDSRINLRDVQLIKIKDLHSDEYVLGELWDDHVNILSPGDVISGVGIVRMNTVRRGYFSTYIQINNFQDAQKKMKIFSDGVESGSFGTQRSSMNTVDIGGSFNSDLEGHIYTRGANSPRSDEFAWGRNKPLQFSTHGAQSGNEDRFRFENSKKVKSGSELPPNSESFKTGSNFTTASPETGKSRSDTLRNGSNVELMGSKDMEGRKVRTQKDRSNPLQNGSNVNLPSSKSVKDCELRTQKDRSVTLQNGSNVNLPSSKNAKDCELRTQKDRSVTLQNGSNVNLPSSKNAKDCELRTQKNRSVILQNGSNVNLPSSKNAKDCELRTQKDRSVTLQNGSNVCLPSSKGMDGCKLMKDHPVSCSDSFGDLDFSFEDDHGTTNDSITIAKNALGVVGKPNSNKVIRPTFHEKWILNRSKTLTVPQNNPKSLQASDIRNTCRKTDGMLCEKVLNSSRGQEVASKLSGAKHESTGFSKEYLDFERMSKTPDLLQHITRIIYPDIYGYDTIKTAGILSLVLPNKNYKQTGLNIILIGDPGLGKSQILLQTSEILQKSVYVTANNTTSAGLTLSLTNDPINGDIAIEAGSFVLSDNGICFIDEFDKLGDTKILFDLIDSGNLSYAKGGVYYEMDVYLSLFCATNPKNGHFDRSKGLRENVVFDDRVLSRFDLIFVMMDRYDHIHLGKILGCDRNESDHSANRAENSDLANGSIKIHNDHAAMPLNKHLENGGKLLPREKYLNLEREGFENLANESKKIQNNRLEATQNILSENGGKLSSSKVDPNFEREGFENLANGSKKMRNDSSDMSRISFFVDNRKFSRGEGNSSSDSKESRNPASESERMYPCHPKAPGNISPENDKRYSHIAIINYLRYVKENIHPSLSSKAKALIKDYFMSLHNINNSDVRLIQSLSKMAIAFAKIFMKGVVSTKEVSMAIELHKSTQIDLKTPGSSGKNAPSSCISSFLSEHHGKKLHVDEILAVLSNQFTKKDPVRVFKQYCHEGIFIDTGSKLFRVNYKPN